MSSSARRYDLVLYGATGFTGGLVSEYLPARLAQENATKNFRWAIAGRSESRLTQVLQTIEKKLKQENIASFILPDIIVVTNTNSSASLAQEVTALTKVVITTVGPYLKYGEVLVQACVSTGTHYCDITGETLFVKAMEDKYAEQAKQSGAILCSMCGFDSVPSDVGALLAVRELQAKYGTQAPQQVTGYAIVKGGGVSGGTIASVLNMLALPTEVVNKSRHPFFLTANPDAHKATSFERDILFPRYDNHIQKWIIPFVMAIANTRCVRRSADLYAREGKATYGDKFQYNECLPMPNLLTAIIYYIVLSLFIIGLGLPPTRYLLTKFVLPAPGEGPSEEKRKKTRFEFRVIASTANNEKTVASITGGDPGYTDTAKMISELAILLSQGKSRVPTGGFYSPAFAGGEEYAARINQSNITGMTCAARPFDQQATSLKIYKK